MQVELILLILSLLFFASIFTDKVGYKFGVPALLLFLAVGMIFGPEGVGKFFNPGGMGYNINIGTAQAMSTIALCIILFSGGMDTKLAEIRPVVGPGVTLATLGVLLTAVITAAVCYVICGLLFSFKDMSIWLALLLAATMSSTDSASVFSILRTNGVGLKHNLRPLLELESGANDPMAYILTITLIGIVNQVGEPVSGLEILQSVLIQLVMGAVMGFLFGKVVVGLLRTARLSNESLYPIMVLTACIFIFSVTYYLKGNPYLAVYIGGLVIGNSKFTKKLQTKSFFDGLTWLSQLVMFLMLGLMVSPHELFSWQVILSGIGISIVMIVIARPLSVWLCLWPFKGYTSNDKKMLSWVGLKGAVPIIFAILCEANEVEGADLIFNVVFLSTLISLLVQGTTLSSMARHLHLAEAPKELKKLEHFDMDLPEEVQASSTEIEVTAEMLTKGNTLRDINLPAKTLVIMVRRGEDFFVPSGQTLLEAGDQLLIISDDDAALAAQYRQTSEEEERLHWSDQLINHTSTFVRDKWQQLVNNRKTPQA